MPKVTIVGAGMAGLTAALRLLERGFEVHLIEQDHFYGGMLRAYKLDGKDEWHEHSYHMFMNWYHNFWQIADEIGIRKNFVPREAFKFLRRGEFPNMPELVNPGGTRYFWRNLTSGAAPIPDLFLFMYSLVDLLSQPIDRDEFLDYYSVNGFMRSRAYATERSAKLQQKIWETVWAIPSYHASTMSYKTFLKYGNYLPDPQLWLLAGNKYDYLIKPLMQKLKSFEPKFTYQNLLLVDALKLDQAGRVAKLVVQTVKVSPSITPGGRPAWGAKKAPDIAVDGDLILAVTPGGLAKLVKDDIYNADPSLGDVRKLESEPMASVELHLTKQIAHIPDDVTVLMDAKYQMTFLDYTQLWPDQQDTFLYVTVSDFKSLMSLVPEQRIGDTLVLNLEKPVTAIDYLLQQVQQHLPFDVADIDLVRTRIQPNSGEDLFANEVGSWRFRPGATTKIPNLFLAGTFCRNFADVSTIEGAVASGLMAAEEIRRRAGIGAPIELIEPEHYPEAMLAALKVWWAPYAVGAKLWSMANDAWGAPYGGPYPGQRFYDPMGPQRRRGY